MPTGRQADGVIKTPLFRSRAHINCTVSTDLYKEAFIFIFYYIEVSHCVTMTYNNIKFRSTARMVSPAHLIIDILLASITEAP